MKAIRVGALCAILLAPVAVSAETVTPTALTPVAPATPAPVTATPSTVAPVLATPKPVATAGSSLPANTELWVSANAEVNSKLVKQGQKFDMTVTRDVMLGDYIVIPRGAKARGQITYRTGKGAFGKSAKMEFDVQEVQLGDRFIPLTGHYRIEGQGNTGATVGAAVAVGVFSVFVTGRSAVIPQGTEYRAYTANPIPITLAPPAETVATPAVVPAAASTTIPAAKASPAAAPTT